MFYAHFVLSKKGPLARIWLAAHWDKKLTKAHVFETNIEGSVEAIIQPKAKLALRTSGHLLLGVVRIYSRKAKYLLADCNEAFVKIKMAFRPGVVDLPEENREAAMSAITLPEAFHEFDTAMADLSDLDVQAHFTGNQSRPEEITMREDLGSIAVVGDDGFGDMGFEGDMMDDDHLDDGLYVKSSDPSSLLLEGAAEPDGDSHHPMDMDFDGQDRQDDTFASPMHDDYEGPPGADDDDDESDRDDFGGGDVDHEDIFGEKFMRDGGGLFEDPMAEPTAPSNGSTLLGQPSIDPFMQPVATPGPDAVTMRPNYMMLGFDTLAAGFPPPKPATPTQDSLTLIQNEAEAFALKPIDITTIGAERKVRKKRKLVIDEQKAIASETMKLQLSDTSDIVTTLDLAPPTKKLMHWKETGGVEKLFAFPGHALVSKKLSRLFTVNLITKSGAEPAEATREALELEQPRPEETEVHDRLSAAGDMPELAPATQDAYWPPTSEAPSIVDDASSFAARMSDGSTLAASAAAAEAATSEDPEPANLDTTQSPPAPSPAPLLPPLPPCDGNSDDDDDNDGGFYNDDASTEEEEERAEEEEDATLEPVEGEAEEEAEERRWNKRSQQMLHSLTRVLARRDEVSFRDLVAAGNRKYVASKFYTLLVLKKSQAVNIEQVEPYGEISISKGAAFTAIC